MTFNANAIYGVSSVIARGTPGGADNDYGVMELDRVVTGYTPYTNAELVNVGDSLTLIGHPVGLPKKFDFGGQVQRVSETLIQGTVDSYGGNSGSPIFDADGNLVGILVGGAPDFVDDGGCDVSNVCPGGSGCTSLGENIVPICVLATATSTIQNQLNFAACNDEVYTTDLSTFYTTDLSTFVTTDLSTFVTTNLSTFFTSGFSTIFTSITSIVTSFTSFTYSFTTLPSSLTSFTSFTTFPSSLLSFSRDSSSSSSDAMIIVPSLIVTYLAAMLI